jgi:hypothetical protein
MFNKMGSHSYSFNIAATSVNKKILGFHNRIGKKNIRLMEFDCKLYFDGVLLVEGKISVSKSTDNYYSCYIKTGLGEFFSIMKDTSMQDIDYDGQRLIGNDDTEIAAYYDDVINGSYPDYDFAVFPVKNMAFFDGSTREAVYRANIQYINYYRSGFISPDKMISPFPYVPYVIKQIFETNGFTIENNLFETDPDLKQLVIYNATSHSKWRYSGGVYFFEFANYINLNQNVPDVPVSDFIEGIPSMFAIGFFPDHVNRRIRIERYKDIILDPQAIDWSENCIVLPEVSDEYFVGYKLEFTLDSADEYAEENVKSMEGLIIEDAVATFASLPIIGNENNATRYVNYDWQYYNWTTYCPDGWNYYCQEFIDYWEGDGSLVFTSDISTLCTIRHKDDHQGAYNRYWLTPITEQPGNNEAMWKVTGEMHENEFSLRLLFFRGMFQDSDGNDYPLGSYDVWDHSGSKISTANLALKWDGPYGLYENLWKDYLHWYINVRRLVKFEKILTSSDLKNIKFYRKYRIQGVNYLIKEINVTITDREIKQAKIDLYRV